MNVLISDLQNLTERLLLSLARKASLEVSECLSRTAGPCLRTSCCKEAAENHLCTHERNPYIQRKFREYTLKKVSFQYSELYVATSLFRGKAQIRKS